MFDELLMKSKAPEAPSVVDHALKADCVDRAPSQAAVAAALAKKQEKLESSDDVKEGEKNLYFSGERVIQVFRPELEAELKALGAVYQPVVSSSDEIPEGLSHLYFTAERAWSAAEMHVDAAISCAVAGKQDRIESSDAIPEGKKNLYFTPARAMDAALLVSPGKEELKAALLHKQDVIVSSDDISEGAKNKYFSADAVKALVEEALKPVLAELESVKAKHKALEAEVEDLKPKWIDSMLGGNGTVRVLTGISKFGVQSQTLTFKSGVLAEVSPASAPKAITSEGV